MAQKPRVILTAGCLHIPFMDESYGKWFLKQIKKYNPDYLVLNGDLWDAESVARFEKKHRYCALKEEYSEVQDFLENVLDRVKPSCKVWYTHGNHEFRLRAPGLSHLASLLDPNIHIPALKHITQREYINHPQYAFHYGKVAIRHGFALSASGIKKEAMDIPPVGGLLIQNHTHRGHGRVAVQYLGRDLPFSYMNGGTGMRLDPTAYYSGYDTQQWSRQAVVVETSERWYKETLLHHSSFWGDK